MSLAWRSASSVCAPLLLSLLLLLLYLATPEPSLAVAWLRSLSLFSSQLICSSLAMSSTLQTCLSLLRWPLKIVSHSYLLWSLSLCLVAVSGSSSSKAYLSRVQTLHSIACMHKLSTWVNIAQQAIN